VAEVALIEALAHPCPYCGRPMDLCQRRPSWDHLKPRSRGGSNHPNNRAICCARCNSHKGNRTLKEWLARLRSYGDARTVHVAIFLLLRE
jgi:5-methylcytosine-specific restriction endonuclease McrA